MRHVTKDMIRAADLPLDLFRSWRHGGLTELGDTALTDAQIRAISRHKNARTLPRYVKRTQRQIIAGTRKRRLTRTNRGSCRNEQPPACRNDQRRNTPSPSNSWRPR